MDGLMDALLACVVAQLANVAINIAFGGTLWNLTVNLNLFAWKSKVGLYSEMEEIVDCMSSSWSNMIESRFHSLQYLNSSIFYEPW